MRGLSTATREQPPLTVTREEARAAAKHNHKKFFSKMDPIYWHHLWAGQLPLLGSKFPEKEQGLGFAQHFISSRAGCSDI